MATNPCPCGFFNDPTRECKCSPMQIQRYVSKISGPLLDRIDIHIDVPAVKFKELASDAPAESSAEIRDRVVRARRVQLERLTTERIYCNAQNVTAIDSQVLRDRFGVEGVTRKRDHAARPIGSRLRSDLEGEPHSCRPRR